MEISKHAAIRLLERAGEFPTDIRPLITPKIAQAMISLGNGKYPLPGGLRAVVKDQTIVTVIYENDRTMSPTDPTPKRNKRKRRRIYRESGEAWGSD
jgi:hypothetical protein